MCGIWGLFGFSASDAKLYCNAFNIAHRGPDNFHVQNVRKMKSCCLAFHRLAIVGTDGGSMQPMTLKAHPHITLMCNGEIYNYKTLCREFDFTPETESDCEVIIHLYAKFGIEKTCALLDGVFAIILVDAEQRRVMFARDTYGVRPMFYFATTTGQVGACSEAKGLSEIANEQNGTQDFFKPFPPAHFAVYDVTKDEKLCSSVLKKFHSFVDWPLHWKHQGIQLNSGSDYETVKENIRTLFTNAVVKRMMSTRRVGSLLSGGLDSSLVAAITARKMKEDHSQLPLPTFSIGMGQSPDVVAARKVAEHIGSEHHEVTITAEDGLGAVDDVIYALESYDVTTVRASAPMYLLAKYISTQTNTIVIMSGEGADELAQGYIYFHKQPTPQEGDKESKRLLEDLFLYDVLRTDRCTAAHGLEVRAPFLDHAFTSYFLSLPAELRKPKDGIEKHLVRSAFDGTGLLPDEILWRKKEAFSDGVSSRKRSWFEILKEHIEDKVLRDRSLTTNDRTGLLVYRSTSSKRTALMRPDRSKQCAPVCKRNVTDHQLSTAPSTFPHNTPRSKEAYYYRSVFERRFGARLCKLIPYQWMPKWIECDDPSARVLSHYQNDEEA